MPKYNVHLYRQMRETHYGVEAADPRAAIEAAEKRPHDAIDDIDSPAGEAIVDLLDDAGDVVSETYIDLDPFDMRAALHQFIDAYRADESAHYDDLMAAAYSKAVLVCPDKALGADEAHKDAAFNVAAGEPNVDLSMGEKP